MSDERRIVAGDLAVEITRTLAEPFRSLRDRLGLVVDHLERHVATATGPAPYPWRSLQALRQDLAGAYLEVNTLARRLDELDRALDDDPVGWFDLSAAVDLGLRLAHHHIESGLEILIDLGNTPNVRGVPGTLALVVAQLVSLCARSAREEPGSTLSVKSFSADDGYAVVLVTDNGAGSDDADAIGELARSIVGEWGATVDAASANGQGCTFELHLITMPVD